MDNHSSEDGSKMITLFIKGGVANTVGDCPLCQRVYMVLKLKDLNFRVMAVNTNAPPTEYKEIAELQSYIPEILCCLEDSSSEVYFNPLREQVHSISTAV